MILQSLFILPVYLAVRRKAVLPITLSEPALIPYCHSYSAALLDLTDSDFPSWFITVI